MRIRSIKPDFYCDEDLCELSPLTRLLFSGLWGLSDGEGRLKYRPKYIKLKVLPWDECDIEAMLRSLDDHGFIQIYDFGGEGYIQVINFKKHQRISGKEASEKSEFPEPPTENEPGKQWGSNGEAVGKQRGSSREAAIVLEGKGREGKGKEGKGKDFVHTTGILKNQMPEISPQASFVEAFKEAYESKTKTAFKADREDYVIAARLIRDYGLAACIEKVKVLGVLCEKRSAWFTKDGWASFTVKKLSSQWNSILPEASQPTEEEETEKKRRKMEDLNERANALIKRG